MMIFIAFIILFILALVVIYRATRLPSYKGKHKFESLVVGHRGCRQFPDIAENSISAFRYAIERGAQGIELDCRLTKDGEVVVIHDDFTYRLTTNKTGRISDMTLDEVEKLEYINVTPSDLINPPKIIDQVPTLKEVMLLAKEHNVKVFVEIKSIDISSCEPLARKVCALFKELEAHDWACVIAFNPLVIYNVRKIDPIIECCMLYYEDLLGSAVHHKLEVVSPIIKYGHKVLDPILHYVAKHVLPEYLGCSMIGPYYQITSPNDIQEFAKRGFSTYVWVPNTLHELVFYKSQKCSVGTDCIFPKQCIRGLESKAYASILDD